jgi:hypothetical protein
MKKELVSCCHFLYLFKNWPTYRNVNVHILSRKCQRTHSQVSLIVVWTWGCNFEIGGFFQQKVGFQFKSQTVYNYYFIYKGNSSEFIHFITNKLKQPLTFYVIYLYFRFLEDKFPVTQTAKWLAETAVFLYFILYWYRSYYTIDRKYSHLNNVNSQDKGLLFNQFVPSVAASV